jgi:hypothetical protein
MATEIVIDPTGTARGIYEETFDFSSLGEVSIHRASLVEPDDRGRWFADLSPVAGPKLGPFILRSQALHAEMTWLRRHWLCRQASSI